MKIILFCEQTYAFGILDPIYRELIRLGHDVLWYVPNTIMSKFDYPDETPSTDDMDVLYNFKSDAIFVPGNEVPHYLRGVKVQVFHGFAGEKKGHFRIRTYFDLYLTQGPYFTRRFEKLASQHQDFRVVETGWPKLDTLFYDQGKYEEEKVRLLGEYQVDNIILYAPTFSPSLTSAPDLAPILSQIAQDERVLILIKFHPKMKRKIIDEYQIRAQKTRNFRIVDDPNIIKYLLLADVMISDTSSAVYEFLFLNKPVITYRSTSKHIQWLNIERAVELQPAIQSVLEKDRFKENRQKIISQYHPYQDGQSASRMIQSVETYIKTYGVPEKRSISWMRRKKIISHFGQIQKKQLQ